MNENEIVNELRDVLAHQAASVDGARTDTIPVADVVADELAPRRRRRASIAAGATLSAVATAAAVVLVVVAIGNTTQKPQPPKDNAAARVQAALAASASAGSFTSSYTIRANEHANSSQCALGHGGPAPIAHSGPVVADPRSAPACAIAGIGQPIDGSATVRVNPLRIESDSRVNGAATSVRVDGDQVWLTAGGGSPLEFTLSDFISTVEQSLGTREGPVVMLSLANPYGYLSMSQDMARNVKPAGTEVLDGITLTDYEVELNADQLADVPGVSAEEARTIQIAVQHLRDNGYTSTTMRIGIGDDGLVHSLTSAAHFDDGSSVTLSSKFLAYGGELVNPAKPTPTTAPTAAPTTTATTVAPTTTTLPGSTTTTAA